MFIKNFEIFKNNQLINPVIHRDSCRQCKRYGTKIDQITYTST